ncbi:MAG TPA: glycosyltransferase [Terriglobia bacterium]|nr:glycosyltransferase [Terriglobia bacterium]
MISKALVVGAYHGKLREISKLGVDLSVVVPDRWGGQKLEDLQADGYELLVTDCRFNAGIPERSTHHFHYYPGISNIVEREDWDVVHIDEEAFNFVTYHSARACGRKGRRVVFFSWQNLMKRYPPPFNFFEHWVFDKALAAIAGSEEVLEIMRRRGFSKPVSVIPQFGVDPSRFRRQEAETLRRKLGLNGAFAVGFIGRIVQEKGLDTLVKALGLLPQDSVLVLIGSGPYRAKLESLVRELGLEKRIRWAPWVNSEEVPEYMNAFDALALPSRTTRAWKEQFGRVLIEAMACETYVVGSDSGEIPNVIGDAGLVFHEGDERALADQLRKLMGDSSLRESLGRRGRERVLERFTHAKIAMDTVDFYSRVCSSNS